MISLQMMRMSGFRYIFKVFMGEFSIRGPMNRGLAYTVEHAIQLASEQYDHLGWSFFLRVYLINYERGSMEEVYAANFPPVKSIFMERYELTHGKPCPDDGDFGFRDGQPINIITSKQKSQLLIY